jgi:hypothetical protein
VTAKFASCVKNQRVNIYKGIKVLVHLLDGEIRRDYRSEKTKVMTEHVV